jgi:hypothetical protein
LMAVWPELQGATAASLLARNSALALVAGSLYWFVGMDAASRLRILQWLQRLRQRGVVTKPPQ